ncbi:MAG: hypothetical protein ACR2PL_10040 [Dehalococcoidia bacterium]
MGSSGPRPRRVHLHVVRSIDAPILLERFLVSAVSCLLILRFYLELTGFPQVGGHGLHVAHMLWGGLLMLISLVLGLSLLGKQAQQLAAVAGGAGFGLFIDELGKFITSDNNYFYRPAFAIIYIIFVLLFLAIHAIDRGRIRTEQAYLVNAIDLVKEAFLHDLNVTQRQRALQLLGQCDPADPVARELQQALAEIPEIPDATPSPLVRLARRLRDFYRQIIQARVFSTAVVTFFLLYALVAVASFVLLVAGVGNLKASGATLSTATLGDLATAAIAGVMILFGVVRMLGVRRSRHDAYHWFRRAVLVSIFLGQIFTFYALQFVAILALAANLIILAALDAMIHQEQLQQGTVVQQQRRGSERIP